MIKTKVDFFGGPDFFQPIRAFWKLFKLLWLAELKPTLQKSHFCFDHVNRLQIPLIGWKKASLPKKATSFLTCKPDKWMHYCTRHTSLMMNIFSVFICRLITVWRYQLFSSSLIMCIMQCYVVWVVYCTFFKVFIIYCTEYVITYIVKGSSL